MCDADDVPVGTRRFGGRTGGGGGNAQAQRPKRAEGDARGWTCSGNGVGRRTHSRSVLSQRPTVLHVPLANQLTIVNKQKQILENIT